MKYTLKHKDVNIAIFDLKYNNIQQLIIDKEQISKLPLPLKRLVKDGYKDEFVEKETDEYYLINEDGCILFDSWLDDRDIPVTRYNYDAYIKKDDTPRKWLLNNNGFSFNDCYWFENEKEELSWSDIVNRLNDLDIYYSVKDETGHYKKHNTTLGGQLEKFWYKEDDNVMLCKKIDMHYDILIAREIIASLIYEKQGYSNYCKYNFIYDTKGNIAGCSCKCFTDTEKELITAYDLLEEYNMTQLDDVWERIVKLAYNYGLPEFKTKNYLDIQTMVDYIITNRDRHQGNIGFIRDTNTLNILKPAPIYDNGSSKYMEGQYPESFSNTTVNGLYKTEIECLQHVRNFSLLKIDLLPTKEEIKNILNKCRGLTEKRINELLSIYDEKIEFLKYLQYEYDRGENISEVLERCKSCKKQEKDFIDFSLD